MQALRVSLLFPAWSAQQKMAHFWPFNARHPVLTSWRSASKLCNGDVGKTCLARRAIPDDGCRLDGCAAHGKAARISAIPRPLRPRQTTPGNSPVSPRGGGLTKSKRPPRKPGRFSSTVH